MSTGSSLQNATYDAADDEYFSTKTSFFITESSIISECVENVEESSESLKTDETNTENNFPAKVSAEDSSLKSPNQSKNEHEYTFDIDSLGKLVSDKVKEHELKEQKEAEALEKQKKFASEESLKSMIIMTKYNEGEKRKSDDSLKALKEEYARIQSSKDNELGRLSELAHKINLEQGENAKKNFIFLNSEDIVNRLKREYAETWGEEFSDILVPFSLKSKEPTKKSRRHYKSMLFNDSVSASATSGSPKTAKFTITPKTKTSERPMTANLDEESLAQTSFTRTFRPPPARRRSVVSDTHHSNGDVFESLMRKMEIGGEEERNGYYESIDLKGTDLSFEELELKIEKILEERKVLKLKLEAEKEEKASLLKGIHQEADDQFKLLFRPLLKGGELVTEKTEQGRFKILHQKVVKQTIINSMKKLFDYINHTGSHNMSEEYTEVLDEIEALFQNEITPVRVYYHNTSDKNEIVGGKLERFSSYSETYRVVNPEKYERNCKLAFLNPLEFKTVTLEGLKYRDSMAFEPCLFMTRDQIAVTCAEVLSSLTSCLKKKGEWV